MVASNNIPITIEGALDATSGRISLGSEPKKILPSLEDYKIPEHEPRRQSPDEIKDIAFSVRHDLWRAMRSEPGLESPEMKEFIAGLTAEERETLDRDVFFSQASFEWLVCVPSKKVNGVIAAIRDLLDAKNKHCPEFYKKRSALHAMLEGDTDTNLQTRRNAIYMRNNPDAAKRQGNDEAFYRKRFQQ